MKRLRRVYLDALRPTLVDGAKDFLLWAHSRWPLYVISDAYTLNGETLDQLLADDGLLKLFRKTYYSDQLGVEKPDPRAVYEICRSQEIRPDQLIHVGDLPERDGQLSKNSGCKFVLFDAPSTTNVLDESNGVLCSLNFDGLKEVLASVG